MFCGNSIRFQTIKRSASYPIVDIYLIEFSDGLSQKLSAFPKKIPMGFAFGSKEYFQVDGELQVTCSVCILGGTRKQCKKITQWVTISIFYSLIFKNFSGLLVDFFIKIPINA